MMVSLAVTAIFLGVGALPEGGAPTLSSNPPVADGGAAVSENGYFQISWTLADAGDDTVFVLEESSSADFANPIEVYHGVDRSTTFSGRQDGVSFFRVKSEGGSWGEPLKVVIQHHSLGEALIYLAAGAAVFLSTAALVIFGHIQHRREGLHQ
ncbi:MAG: hypothetical protein R3E58_01045 [Phycisphaerae bacterium]